MPERGRSPRRGYWTRALSLFSLSALILQGCNDSSRSLGPWSVASWVVGASLIDSDRALSDFDDHLDEAHALQLKELSNQAKSDGRLGLLTLSESSLGRWRGLYAYSSAKTLIGLEVELTQSQGVWSIRDLPHFKTYLALINLAQQLPISEEGAPWEGGLIGRDLRARSLSAVPLALTSEGVVIDGLALTEVNQAQVSERLGSAFRQRSRAARRAQASYSPHVALALSADAPAAELSRLVDWVEGAGAEVVSLITRDIKGELALIYLARRVESAHITTPQRLIQGRVDSGVWRAAIQEPFKSPEPITDMINFMHLSAQLTSQDQRDVSAVIVGAFQEARRRGELHGLNLTLIGEAKVADLVSVISFTRVMDPTIPISVLGE